MRSTAFLIILLLAVTLSSLGSLLRPPSLESQPSPILEATDLGSRIDLNTADAATLCLLPGIGPPMSHRIIEQRSSRPFSGLDDLKRVSGVGDSILTRVRPYVAESARR